MFSTLHDFSKTFDIKKLYNGTYLLAYTIDCLYRRRIRRLLRSIIERSILFYNNLLGIIASFPSDPVVCYGGVSTLYCGSNRSDIGTLAWIVQVKGITLTILVN